MCGDLGEREGLSGLCFWWGKGLVSEGWRRDGTGLWFEVEEGWMRAGWGWFRIANWFLRARRFGVFGLAGLGRCIRAFAHFEYA